MEREAIILVSPMLPEEGASSGAPSPRQPLHILLNLLSHGLGLIFHQRRWLLPGTGLTLRGASSHISTAGTNRETTSKKKVI